MSTPNSSIARRLDDDHSIDMRTTHSTQTSEKKRHVAATAENGPNSLVHSSTSSIQDDAVESVKSSPTPHDAEEEVVMADATADTGSNNLKNSKTDADREKGSEMSLMENGHSVSTTDDEEKVRARNLRNGQGAHLEKAAKTTVSSPDPSATNHAGSATDRRVGGPPIAERARLSTMVSLNTTSAVDTSDGPVAKFAAPSAGDTDAVADADVDDAATKPSKKSLSPPTPTGSPIPPVKKNLNESTLKALESYLKSGEFLCTDLLEYEELLAYEQKIHKYSSERMRVRQIMLLPEEIDDESSHANKTNGGTLISEEEKMYNEIYQEEEFHTIATDFSKSVAIETADRERSGFILHNKTFNWVKRAAGLTRPYDPYSQHHPSSQIQTGRSSKQGGGGDDQDSGDETDEGGDSEHASGAPSGATGGRRLTRRHARMTRKKRREERMEKETEGLRILAEMAKDMKRERAKNLAAERKNRKEADQRFRGRLDGESSDDDHDDEYGLFCNTDRASGIRVKQIFPRLEMGQFARHGSATITTAPLQDPLSLSMLEWEERKKGTHVVDVAEALLPQSEELPRPLADMGFEYRQPPLKVAKLDASGSHSLLKRKYMIAERLREHQMVTESQYSAYDPIPVGAMVTAFHPKQKKNAVGKLLLHDPYKQEYLVQFHTKELGWDMCRESDVVENIQLVLLDANGNTKTPDLEDKGEIEREVLVALLTTIKEAFDRKALILQALEMIADDKTVFANATLQSLWLLSNLERVNCTLDAALKRFQIMYGKAYADPELLVQLIKVESKKKMLRKEIPRTKSLQEWSAALASVSNTIGGSICADFFNKDCSERGVGNDSHKFQQSISDSAHLLLMANYMEQTATDRDACMTSRGAVDAAFQTGLDKYMQNSLPPTMETKLRVTSNLVQDSQLEGAMHELGGAIGMLRAELALTAQATVKEQPSNDMMEIDV